MSYSVELAESAHKDLKASVSEAFWPDLLEELARLGLNPKLGRRVTEGPLAGRWIYVFRISRPPWTRRFAVAYCFSQDEETIFITQVVPPGTLRPADEL